MKFIFTIFLMCLVLTISVKSYSADYTISSICMLQTSDNGRAYLSPCEGWTSKNSCSNGWITWDIKTDSGKLMYSNALTAFASDKRITVRMNGSSCAGYDVTNMIRILKN